MSKTKTTKPTEEIKRRAPRKKRKAPSTGLGVLRKEQQREALREKLQGIEYLRQIENGMKELDAQKQAVQKARNSKADPYVIQEVQSKADCVNRLIKTQMDTNFKRLAKVLPDLKQIELTDAEGKNPLGSLADALREAVSGTTAE